MKYDLIVVGGGASGFFAAINTAILNPKLKILILEKSNKVLAKVAISGGGRCNVTHYCETTKELIEAYPRGGNSLKKLFPNWTTQDTTAWFEKRGVQLKVEADGRMFPVSNSSDDVVNCLLKAAHVNRIEVKMQQIISKIEKQNGGFLVHTEKHTFNTQRVLIAIGGQPKQQGFNFLGDFELEYQTPVPSLFTFQVPEKALHDLMGISVPNSIVKLTGSKLQSQGPLLITHAGFSGPAVLKLSAFAARTMAEQKYQCQVLINFTGLNTEAEVSEALNQHKTKHAKGKLSNHIPFELATRLWQFLCLRNEIDTEKCWQDLSKKETNKLLNALYVSDFKVTGKSTYKDEFVTCGGVAVSNLDMNTMQAKNYPGLYFAGEAIDIDGITGGYNFQAAWAGGVQVARSIAAETLAYQAI